MPKHDEPSGKGPRHIQSMPTRMGRRLFVWDDDGVSHGMMSWAQAFERKVLGPVRV